MGKHNAPPPEKTPDHKPEHGRPGSHRDTGYVGTHRRRDGHETEK